MACLRKFNNGLIIGETETRAVERLTAIKHELENNEDIHSIFGDPVGPKWQETYIELANGAAPTVIATAKLPATEHLTLRLTADEKKFSFAYTSQPDATDAWRTLAAPADIIPVTVQAAGGGLHFTGAVLGPHARLDP